MRDQAIYINVSGLVYETRERTLTKYADTLLGDEARRLEYFCPLRNEYFFDRHRESFSSILFFYQSIGKLCRPPHVSLKVFIEECEFFQLPQCAIISMKRKEGGFLEDDIIDFVNPKEKAVPTCRRKLWNFFEDPTSSKYALQFAYLYLTLLLLSTAINCIQTSRQFVNRSHRHSVWEMSDIAINIYFLIEFIIRLVVSPSKVQFFKRVLVWIDFIALATFIPLISKHYSNHSVVLFFTPFQLFRIVRVFRVAKILPGYNITEIIVKNTLGLFRIVVICLFFLVTVGAFLVYHTERRQHNTVFTSIPVTMYWAVQTIVTVGYGDMVPSTFWGKFFASLFIICFIPILSVPVLSIIVKFARFYDFFNALATKDGHVAFSSL